MNSEEEVDHELDGLMVQKVLGERGLTIQQAGRCKRDREKWRMNDLSIMNKEEPQLIVLYWSIDDVLQHRGLGVGVNAA